VLVLRKADGHIKVVFWNNTAWNTPVEPEFQQLWNSLRLPPNQFEIRKELLAEGHTSKAEPLGTVRRALKREKGKKKSNFRRQKTTNIHLDYNIWDDVDMLARGSG